MPLVSIVTPSLNQGRFIEDTILAVKNQDYPDIEHIIIDGGSTDNTINILRKHEKEYNLKWISESDEGQSDALNKGFRIAKGEIIGWLNSDDVYFSKDVISYVVEQFIKNPNIDIIYGNDVFVDLNNNIFRVRQLFNWNYNKLLRGLSISQPATFFRKDIILKNHLNKNLQFGMDLEFWLRLGKSYAFKHVNRILAGNRIHKERRTISGGEKARMEYRMIMREYGQKFDLKYYFLHYFLDFLYIQIKKVVGLKVILKINEEINNLAFRGKSQNILRRIYSQIAPISWLLH